jgi:cytochrome c556
LPTTRDEIGGSAFRSLPGATVSLISWKNNDKEAGHVSDQTFGGDAVKARMDSMEMIRKNTKVIGQMAKGVMLFDAEAARAAALAIAREAALTPDLFKVPADDPKSEAVPAIWENFADFEARLLELRDVALEVAETISQPEDAKRALGSIGGTCKACHTHYRK